MRFDAAHVTQNLRLLPDNTTFHSRNSFTAGSKWDDPSLEGLTGKLFKLEQMY